MSLFAEDLCANTDEHSRYALEPFSSWRRLQTGSCVLLDKKSLLTESKERH